MALRHVVGSLFIACFIILHVECAPRLGRDDDSGFDSGSGSEDPDAEADDEYDDVGAADAEYSSEDDPDPNGSQPTRPENPIGGDDDVGDGMDVPTSVAPGNVDEDHEDEMYSEEDDAAYEEYEDNDVSENGFVSLNNNNVGTGQTEKPAIATSPKSVDKNVGEVVSPGDKPNERDMFFGRPDPVKPEVVKPEVVKPDVVKPDVVKPEVAENGDNEVYLDLGEDAGPSGKPNERDMFFGKPDPVKPEVVKPEVVKPEVAENGDYEVYLDLGEDAGPSGKPTERDMFFGKPDPVKPEVVKPEVSDTGNGLVGIGVQKTDVMLVFDEGGDSDDSQIEEDPEIVSLKRGDYKKDDFFDTIGAKKLDDFIPKATETKKAQDFIEGHSAVSNNMNYIFGASNGDKTMKDDFFDSIADKNIVSDKVDSKLHANKANNQVGAFVAKTDTQGPGSGLAVEEQLKMKQLILKALQLFMDSPCQVGARFRRVAKCAVLQDVLKALTISGLTFGADKQYQKPKYAAKPSMKQPWKWGVVPNVLMGQ